MQARYFLGAREAAKHGCIVRLFLDGKQWVKIFLRKRTFNAGCSAFQYVQIDERAAVYRL